MNIHVERTRTAHIIRVSGRWDAFSSPVFEEFSENFLKKENPRHVVLDLEGVTYISSFGLRGLLNLGRDLERAGGLLRVAAMTSEVGRIFSGIGFEALFEVFPDVESALDSLKR